MDQTTRLPLQGPRRVSPIATVGIAAALAVGFGWSVRDEYFLVPSEGLGYALGVAGLAMMLLLLLYSARKRWSPLRAAGAMPVWFQIHMALGLLGPTAILFHANFHFGSLNANVALACMLTVSLSGVVGRFIYTRVHDEYLGRFASLAELREASHGRGKTLALAVAAAPEAGRALSGFREQALGQHAGPGGRVSTLLLGGHRSRAARRRILAAVEAARGSADLPGRRAVRRAVREHLRVIRTAAEFEAYERLFALWHALHLPFCIVLFVAAAVHVVAVHMY
jgi:hypothetical protein